MSKELMKQKTKLVAFMSKGTEHYIDVEDADSMLQKLQTLEYIVDDQGIPVPRKNIIDFCWEYQLEDKRKQMRGWYVKGAYWYDKYGKEMGMTTEAEKRRYAKERKRQAEIDSISPEQRAKNSAKLKEMMSGMFNMPK